MTALIPLTAAHGQNPEAAAAPPAKVRPIPPPGIPIKDADGRELADGLASLGKEIDALRADLKAKPDLLRFLPDVQIYYNAVHYALTYNEFFKPAEVATAKRFLTLGQERAKALRAGDAPWTKQTGLVVLGYVSRIDGSVQPYGLVVPKEWTGGDRTPRRLDIFLHGRGEMLNEISFIDSHQKSAGEFTPPGALVLHPYGRYCNANRFAGEVDVLEARDDVKARYTIDPDRVVMRGFSMGGASSWQFATHHADEWVAASPGAGFTETATYTHAFEAGKTPPPAYEQQLWHLYDPVDYAVNLAQCPTVGYSGLDDPQKRAADNMETAMAKEGLTLARVLAPNTKHNYTPDAKKQINEFIDAAVVKGRDRMPTHLRFTTFTLRYNRMDWLTVTGLEHHWQRARVDGTLDGSDGVTLTTQNVSRLMLDLPPSRTKVTIDGQALAGRRFVKSGNGKWKAEGSDDSALRKRPGLQGPIDDVFMDRFVVVRPTGTPRSPQTGAWVTAEMAHAAHQWRGMFRGEMSIVSDRDLTDAQIASSNLILWGDPSSNSVLAKIADKLPIRWQKDGSVKIGDKTYPAGTSVPVLIYPNPLNSSRYVVLNSGLTWREAHVLTNAQQTPKLPDWAIVDITTPPDARAPGRIAAAGFFDEEWKLK